MLRPRRPQKREGGRPRGLGTQPVDRAMDVFESQVAIVTGAAQGLGESIARMLAKNGCSVMLFDTKEEKARAVVHSLRELENDSANSKAQFEVCAVDVSDEAAVQAGFQTFRSKFDRLDIMVNCAGILGPSHVKTEEVDVADFDRVYAGRRTRLYNVLLKLIYANETE